jgi:hypothetical protein
MDAGVFALARFHRMIVAGASNEPPQKEPVMADESIPPTGESAQDVISRADYVALQEELRLARADRDRQAFEKGEIVTRANGFARERDVMADRVAAANAERDRILDEKNAESSRADAAETRAAEAEARIVETRRRLDAAEEEVSRLRAQIASAPPKQPLELLWLVLCDETRAAVAWVRSRIPADSPLLPWYDKAIETTQRIGCEAIRLAGVFYDWAKPRAISLFHRGKAELEARLGKK